MTGFEPIFSFAQYNHTIKGIASESIH